MAHWYNNLHAEILFLLTDSEHLLMAFGYSGLANVIARERARVSSRRHGPLSVVFGSDKETGISYTGGPTENE
jgi:hypothetical protein